ncbi:hypothetical protein X975_00724, partial [Stegodyphus mimosarum]
MLQLIFVVMTIAFIVSSATDGAAVLEPKLVMKRGNNVRLCGRMLVETLNLLCDGEYYDPGENRMGKRNFGTEQAEIDAFPQWLVLALTSKAQFEASQTNPDLTAFHKRRQRGIVDECCRQSCTISTLLSYCR